MAAIATANPTTTGDQQRIEKNTKNVDKQNDCADGDGDAININYITTATTPLNNCSIAEREGQQYNDMDKYNHQFNRIPSSDINKLSSSLIDYSTSSYQYQHQHHSSSSNTLCDNDRAAHKESMSSLNSTTAAAAAADRSDSCALIGSVHTDPESGSEQNADEKDIMAVELNDNFTAHSSAAIHQSDGKTSADDSSRVQRFIVKKDRSNECFADANVDGSNSARYAKHSKDAIKTFILNDPQTANVSATISLTTLQKHSLQKNAESIHSASNVPCTTISTSQCQSVKIEKQAMFAKLDSNAIGRTSSPVLIVHPASQKLFAVHKLKSASAASASVSAAASAAALASTTTTTNRLVSLATTLPASNTIRLELNDAAQRASQSECSTLSRLSRSNESSAISGSSSSSNTRASLNRRFNNGTGAGLIDISQGSSDRLQRWKSKLHTTTTGRRHKDTSEPPPIDRNMIITHHQISGHSSDAELILDWRPNNNFFPLQASASEMMNRNNNNNNNKSVLPSEIMRPRMLHTAQSTLDLMHSNNNNNNNIVSLVNSEMKHQTVMQCGENNSKSPNNNSNLTMHFQNIQNLQNLMQTVEGFENLTKNSLPPPVRITPFSGIKPQDSDIIRPVAFRACIPKNSEMAAPSIKCIGYAKDDLNIQTAHHHHHGMNALKGTTKVLNEQISLTSIGNNRPHPVVYQPSTSSQSSFVCTQQQKATTRRCTNEENDYDIVPEYIDRNHMFIDGENENYSVLYQTSLQTGSTAHIRNHKDLPVVQQLFNNSNNNSSNNHINSFPLNINSNRSAASPKKSCSSHQIYGSNTSNGSRNSSGIHVTPSPSDSGIVDYESIIRDKENELATVRNTMEHNEEIIVRVYQEKEKVWKEQLADLKQKLQASQQGENALRQQIQRCNEQREHFTTIINNLNSEKQGLQRKCMQIEREMMQIRERFNEVMRSHDHDRECESCKRHSSRIDSDHIMQIQALKRPKQKDTNSKDADLRVEVEQLRGEISTLRDALNEQIELFTDERKRWENERNQMMKCNNNNNNNNKNNSRRNTTTTTTSSTTTSVGCSSNAFNSRGISNGETSTECIISDDRLI